MDNNYEPHEINLARELSETLNDPEGLPLYLKFAKQYQEPFLHKILDRVMSVDEKKIKKSRAALFTYLISQVPYDPRSQP